MTGKDVLPEKNLARKSCQNGKIWIFALGKELKAQTNIAKKQYHKLDNTYEFDEIIKKEKPTLKKYNRSNLIWDSKYIFYPYYNIIDFLLSQNIQFDSRSLLNWINLII